MGFVNKPKFEHTCNQCILIGQDDGHDVYVHVDKLDSGNTHVSLVIRYGNNGADYFSPDANTIPQMYRVWVNTLPRWTPNAIPGKWYKG